MSIKGQGHSLTLVKGHSDFKVKCMTFGSYNQVSDSGSQGPLVFKGILNARSQIYKSSRGGGGRGGGVIIPAGSSRRASQPLFRRIF